MVLSDFDENIIIGSFTLSNTLSHFPVTEILSQCNLGNPLRSATPKGMGAVSLILWTSVLELEPVKTPGGPVGTKLADSVGPGWVHECAGLSSSQVLLMLLVQRPSL